MPARFGESVVSPGAPRTSAVVETVNTDDGALTPDVSLRLIAQSPSLPLSL